MSYPNPRAHTLPDGEDADQEQYVVWARSDGAAGILAFRDPGAVRRSAAVTDDEVFRVLLRTDNYTTATKTLAAALTEVR